MISSKNINPLLLSSIGILLSVNSVTSYSQIEEITVTAQRRAENIQEVPIAITAFSEEQMQNQQITETLDITRSVPNFIGGRGTGTGTSNVYSIRGLNNTESIATFDPPVGTYIGDIFVQRQSANNFSLFDVERIEVLRGPQGTLFGRNTTGGAVRVIPKKPAEELGGYFEAGYGRFDRTLLRGSVELPVSDSVFTKFSAYSIEDDGFVDNLTTGADNGNFEENAGANASIRVLFSDAASWDASITFIDNSHTNLVNVEVDGDRVNNSGLITGALAAIGPFGAPILTGEKANFPGNENRAKSLLISSDLAWDTAAGTVNLITGYLSLEHQFNFDLFDGDFSGGTGRFSIANDGDHDQLTQEIKLSGLALGDRLNYVTGIYYFREDNRTDFGDVFTVPGPPGGLPLTLADRVLDNTTEAIAVYGQLDYDVTDTVTATIGLRYTDEEKDIAYTPNTMAPGSFSTADINAAGIPTEQGKTIFTPRFALQYELSEELMFYGSATRGFKSGGWNARGTAANEIQAFAPETVWSYEIGTRSEWFDNRLRVNLTGFYSAISDFQLPSSFVRNNGRLAFITGNFADLDVKGFEAEILLVPIEGLTLYANIGLQDAKYKSLDSAILLQQQQCLTGTVVGDSVPCGQGIINPAGDIATPVRSPKQTVSAGASYAWLIGSGITLTPSINVTSYGDHAVGTNNVDPAGDTVSYSNVTAGITLEDLEQGWSATLNCKNCTDRDQIVSNLGGFTYINDPMRWNFSVRYNF